MSQEPGAGVPGGPPRVGVPGGPPAPPPPPVAGGTWSAPSTGAPGGVPGPNGAQAPWAAPASGGNGCLKACLVVGGIGVVLAVIGIAALVILGGRFVEEIQQNPDAFFGAPCPIVSSDAIADAVGQPVEAFELEGLMGGTMDAVLDKRLLANAPDCYAIGDDGFVARIAVDDTGGAAAFADARAEADGRFLRADQPDIGDEAFCTEVSDAGSAGVLVRWGGTVAYVSVANSTGQDADRACAIAKQVARTLGP